MTTVRIRIEVDGRELDFPASVGQPEGDPSPLVAHLLRALAERVETAGIERLTAENARLVEDDAARVDDLAVLQQAAWAVVDEYDNYIGEDGRPPSWTLPAIDELRAALPARRDHL